MRVPFNDPRRQVLALHDEIAGVVERVLQSGRYIMGPEHDAFERDFAAYCGTGDCVAVGNGTDALELSLRAAGCGPGDEVITVANAGMYATTAILRVGAVPVFADVDARSLLLSAETLEPALSSSTRAVVVTHLYGKLATVPALRRLTASRGVLLIEDCAQAHGASIEGRVAGSFGDLAAFSFYPTKNLGALGDAGCVVTTSADLARRLRELRQYGWTAKYMATTPGGRNSRMDEMQAAVLRLKLRHLDAWNARRREIHCEYAEASDGTELSLVHRDGADFAAHLSVGRHPRRDELRTALAADGIGTDIHYPRPDHQQAALASVRWRSPGSLRETEKAAEEVLSLPCFPELSDPEVAHVCECLRNRA